MTQSKLEPESVCCTIWFDDTLPSLNIPDSMTVRTYEVDKALMDWYQRAEKLWYSDRENEQYDRLLYHAQQAIYRATGYPIGVQLNECAPMSSAPPEEGTHTPHDRVGGR